MENKSSIIVISSALILVMALSLGGVNSVSAQTDVEGNATVQQAPFPLLKHGPPQLLGLNEERRCVTQSSR